jgi:hypothetical protein
MDIRLPGYYATSGSTSGTHVFQLYWLERNRTFKIPCDEFIRDGDDALARFPSCIDGTYKMTVLRVAPQVAPQEQSRDAEPLVPAVAEAGAAAAFGG